MQLACNCSGEKMEERTVTFLEKYLSIYSWDAKMAIILAAFAGCYGEFDLLVKYPNDPAVANLRLLKKIQGNIVDVANSIKAKAQIIVDAMLITSLSKFYEYPSHLTEMTSAEVAYWVIRSVMTYATYINALMRNE